jgi:hypothetical protein
MSRAQRFASATVLLLFALPSVTSTPAAGRGFCNIDGLGTKDLQQEVANAAAVFFEGGSQLRAERL